MDDDNFWEGTLEEPEIVWFGGSARQPLPPTPPGNVATNPRDDAGAPQVDEDEEEIEPLLRSSPPIVARGDSTSSHSSNAAGGVAVAVPSATTERLPAPATHSYLGEARTGAGLSRKDLEVGSTVEMPILSLPGVVLFPGESLPLRLHNLAYATLAESMLAGEDAGGTRGGRLGRNTRQAARHLGVVNRLNSRRGGG